MKTDIKAGSAYVELLLRNKAFLAGLEKSGQKLKGFGFAAARLAGLSLFAGGAALAFPIKWAAALEVARAQFTALTGSAEKASAIIAGLEKFSATALIPVDELQRTSQLLLGYGVAAKNVVPTVKALAEISRGNADRFNLLALAYGQVVAKQRLYAAEVRQFVESGFNPLQQIAQMTGETMAEVSARLEAGGIAASEVAKALEAAVGPGGRFNGLLAKMGDTATGAFNKLRTNLMLALRPIGEAFIPAIKNALDTVNAAMPAISQIVFGMAASIKASLDGTGATVMSAMSYIADVFMSTWAFAQGVVNSAVKAISFSLFNWQAIAQSVLVSAELAVVRFANQTIHFFTVAIPGYLAWFRDNWRDVFTDVMNITATIATNIGANLKALWDAVVSWMSGDGFNFEWTPLTKGFESAIKELPKIAEREMGPLEASLQAELDGIMGDVMGKWDEHSKAFDQELESQKRERDKLAADMQRKRDEDAEAAMGGIAPDGGQLDASKMKKEVFVAFSAAAAARQAGDKSDPVKEQTKQQQRNHKEMLAVLRDGGVFA